MPGTDFDLTNGLSRSLKPKRAIPVRTISPTRLSLSLRFPLEQALLRGSLLGCMCIVRITPLAIFALLSERRPFFFSIRENGGSYYFHSVTMFPNGSLGFAPTNNQHRTTIIHDDASFLIGSIKFNDLDDDYNLIIQLNILNRRVFSL